MDASLHRGGRVRRALVPLSAVLCLALAAAGCDGSPDGSGADRGGSASGAAESAPRSPGTMRLSGSDNDLQRAYENVIRNVLPSVVQINAASAIGSGIVYDNNGHIVTNAHVVGKHKSFKVTAATNETPQAATLVASYPQQDLAVIKLDRVPGGLRPATFGDSGKVDVGQIVLAMGSPLGLSSSVTQGIVSAVGRTVTEGQSSGGTGATIANMVQTSAAINPGNSGGALVNLDGQVIGIPTLAATDPNIGNGGSAAPGIGFAIPVSTVKKVTDQLIKYRKVVRSGRAGLGIIGRTVLNDSFQPTGVAVVSLTKGGGAAQAGLKPGDIITAVAHTRVTDITSLSETLASFKPGDRVAVTYVRADSAKTTKVTLSQV